MAKNYTNIFDVMIDFNLFMYQVKGLNPSLALYTAVAKNRWDFLVENSNSFFLRFEQAANGDEVLQKNLKDFSSAVQSYKLGSKHNPLESNQNYLKYFPFLSLITLSELRLTNEEVHFVNLENFRVGQFDVSDFKNMAALMRQQIADSTSSVGRGDDKGSVIFGGESVKSQRDNTFDDFLQIESAIQLEQYIEGVIFAFKQSQDRPPNLLAFVNNNIDSGTNVSIIDAYRSYYSVPFQGSLEQMAQKFLGDSRRWFELVTVNNLQPPFIDEYGMKYSLIAPGGANTVTVSAAQSNDAQVGQKVRVGSLKFREESRIVEKKVLNDDGSMTLSLSGEQNLNRLKPKELAYVRIYKAGTVNSGSMILIPIDVRSNLPTPLTPNSDALRRLDQELLAFGIDIARDEKTGDLVIDSTGNFKMAVGLENVRQTIYWLLRTPVGQLPFHPTFGIDLGLGNTFFGSQDEMLLFSNIIKKNIMRDPRFTDVQVTKLKSTGNGIGLELLVKIGNSNIYLPLSFVS